MTTPSLVAQVVSGRLSQAAQAATTLGLATADVYSNQTIASLSNDLVSCPGSPCLTREPAPNDCKTINIVSRVRPIAKTFRNEVPSFVASLST